VAREALREAARALLLVALRLAVVLRRVDVALRCVEAAVPVERDVLRDDALRVEALRVVPVLLARVVPVLLARVDALLRAAGLRALVERLLVVLALLFVLSAMVLSSGLFL
jgi:hypothetical protein